MTGKFDGDAFSRGDVLREIKDLKRRLGGLETARRLESATVGAGGLRIKDGGSVTVEDASGAAVDLSTLAFGIRTAQVTAQEGTTSTVFTNLATPGPTIPDLAIGSSRRCLVLISCSVGASANNLAIASVEVSGASTISAGDNADASAFISSAGATAITASAMSVILLDASRGLNAGLNTFQLKYKADNAASEPAFKDRKIVVLPY